MRKHHLSGDSADRSGASIGTGKLVGSEASGRRDPIRWLIGCGIVLIAAVVVGTIIMISNFRDRAIMNSERELENAAQLLARHFDQELGDFKVVQNVLAAKMHDIASSDDFKQRMSTYEMHLWLQSRLEGATDATGVNIYDADGALATSSLMFPVPAVSISDRKYFRLLKFVSIGILGCRIVAQPLNGRNSNSHCLQDDGSKWRISWSRDARVFSGKI